MTDDSPTFDAERHEWVFDDGTRLPLVAGGEDPPTPPADPPPPVESTFTQADIDKIVQDRLARERAKFADYDALKQKASQFDQLENEKKTETQRLTDELAAAQQAAAAAAQQARDATTKAAVMAATVGKVVDPDVAHRLIADKVTFDETGAATNITELIDELVASKPYLAANPGGQARTGDLPANQGARGTDAITRDDLKAMSPEDVEMAFKEGRLAGVLGQAR